MTIEEIHKAVDDHQVEDDLTLAKLNNEITQANTEKQAALDQIEVLEARIAELESQLPHTQHVELGAWAEFNADGNSSLEEQARFDTLSGVPMRASMMYGPFQVSGQAYKFAISTDIYNAGRWPHWAWGNKLPSNETPATYIPNIAAGKYDALLTQTAKNIVAVAQGRRFQLRPWWEANGRWMAACALNYGQDTSKYRAAWVRMAQIFRTEAPDVELVWSPAWKSLPDESWNDMKNYYPGDQWVDRIGVEPYNKYGTDTNIWRSFQELSAETLAVSGLPVMMTEASCLEDPANVNRKAQWITDMAEYVKSEPRWKELLWFHRPPTTAEKKDFRVDTSPQALAAWQALCADPYFQAHP